MTANPWAASSNPSSITFLEIDQEVLLMAIFPFPLVQEGQLSGTGKIICTWHLALMNDDGGLSLPKNRVSRWTYSLNIDPYNVDWTVKVPKQLSVQGYFCIFQVFSLFLCLYVFFCSFFAIKSSAMMNLALRNLSYDV